MAKISHKVSIKAPQAYVFKAIATAEGLKSWYTPQHSTSQRERCEGERGYLPVYRPGHLSLEICGAFTDLGSALGMCRRAGDYDRNERYVSPI
jgi:hypothetical protein